MRSLQGFSDIVIGAQVCCVKFSVATLIRIDSVYTYTYIHTQMSEIRPKESAKDAGLGRKVFGTVRVSVGAVANLIRIEELRPLVVQSLERAWDCTVDAGRCDSILDKINQNWTTVRRFVLGAQVSNGTGGDIRQGPLSEIVAMLDERLTGGAGLTGSNLKYRTMGDREKLVEFLERVHAHNSRMAETEAAIELADRILRQLSRFVDVRLMDG